jgi:hypothetical protein
MSIIRRGRTEHQELLSRVLYSKVVAHTRTENRGCHAHGLSPVAILLFFLYLFAFELSGFIVKITLCKEKLNFTITVRIRRVGAQSQE